MTIMVKRLERRETGKRKNGKIKRSSWWEFQQRFLKKAKKRTSV